jgi:hypothetical protein
MQRSIGTFNRVAAATNTSGEGLIADLMSYLVSPAAKWMTGASVRMDGGEIKTI